MTNEWTQSALHYLRWFLRSRAYGGFPFIVEEARLWAYHKGLEAPKDERHWGTVTRIAIADKIIMATGKFAAAKSSHNSPKRLYRRAS